MRRRRAAIRNRRRRWALIYVQSAHHNTALLTRHLLLLGLLLLLPLLFWLTLGNRVHYCPLSWRLNHSYEWSCVGCCVDYVLIANEPPQVSNSSEPRPPFLGDLGSLVLYRIRERLLCSHIPNEPIFMGKRSLFRNNFSKRDRCESTLRLGGHIRPD